MLCAFSLKQNLATIMAEEKSNTIPCIHGIRVLNLIFLLGGFRFLVTVLMPDTNWMDIADVRLKLKFSGVRENNE